MKRASRLCRWFEFAFVAAHFSAPSAARQPPVISVGKGTSFDNFAAVLGGSEMKRVIATAALALVLAPFQTAKEQNGGRLVLPNPNLLRCRSSDCSQLWTDKADADSVFPTQIRVDMDHNCIYGFTAVCDESVSMDALAKTINERYKRWALADMTKPSIRLWRVESEKLVIQLSAADKKDEKSGFALAGTKQLIFLPNGGRSACANP
jgi:hypothetical protein